MDSYHGKKHVDVYHSGSNNVKFTPVATSGQPTLASLCKCAKLSNPKTSDVAQDRSTFLAKSKIHLDEAASDEEIHKVLKKAKAGSLVLQLHRTDHTNSSSAAKKKHLWR